MRTAYVSLIGRGDVRIEEQELPRLGHRTALMLLRAYHTSIPFAKSVTNQMPLSRIQEVLELACNIDCMKAVVPAQV